MSTLEIFAVIISIIGVGLTILRHMWCWFFNFLAYILYGYLFYTYQLYGEVILQFIFLAMNFYGLYFWLKTKQQENEIRIETPIKSHLLYQIILTAILGLFFGISLKYFTNAAVPMLDAQLAAFSLLATYWTSRKYIATWPLWVVVDIIYVGMFLYKDLYLTSALYAMFIIMAFYGWKKWQVTKQNQSSNILV